MHNKLSLIKNIENLGIQKTDALMIHSSMKSIGHVDGGANTVLDAFTEYLSQDGLLIFPTHTWDSINDDNPVYDPLKEASCVGILSNIFMKRDGVTRSLHATHSVAAIGKRAKEYLYGEEFSDTPCPKKGCWGKLYDYNAKILFLGCSTKKNTFIHSVEEKADIPNRLTKNYFQFKIKLSDGSIFNRPMKRHESPVGDISQNYDKVIPVLEYKGKIIKGTFGDAHCVICNAVDVEEITKMLLKKDIDLFIDDKPVPQKFYI